MTQGGPSAEHDSRRRNGRIETSTDRSSSHHPAARLRQVTISLIGFGIGLALFGWIIAKAAEGDGWSRLASASPWLIVLLLGCTLVSAFVNGCTFWLTVRPLHRLDFVELQMVNVAAGMLNYAPLRLGALGRAAWHLRLDRVPILEMSAWFGVIGYVLVLAVGSALVATILHDRLDWIWLALVIGQMILGGAAIRLATGLPLLGRALVHVETIVSDGSALWGSMALRLIDLAAFTGRFAAALAILDIHLAATEMVALGVVALAAGLIPFGRLGFREVCVGLTAARIGGEIPWAELAVIESMGEIAIFVPLGFAALPWLRKRWKKRRTVLRGGRQHP